MRPLISVAGRRRRPEGHERVGEAKLHRFVEEKPGKDLPDNGTVCFW